LWNKIIFSKAIEKNRKKCLGQREKHDAVGSKPPRNIEENEKERKALRKKFEEHGMKRYMDFKNSLSRIIIFYNFNSYLYF
jgi:hypothetical protein